MLDLAIAIFQKAFRTIIIDHQCSLKRNSVFCILHKRIKKNTGIFGVKCIS